MRRNEHTHTHNVIATNFTLESEEMKRRMIRSNDSFQGNNNNFSPLFYKDGRTDGQTDGKTDSPSAYAATKTRRVLMEKESMFA